MKVNKLLGFCCLLVIFFCFIQNIINAKEVSFENIRKNARSASYEISIAKLDIDISDVVFWQALTESLVPKLNLTFVSEYLKDLNDDDRNTNYIGNSFIGQETKYQDSLSLELNYSLLNFGVNKKNLVVAGIDKTQKYIAYNAKIQEISLKLLANYSDMLLNINKLSSYKEILKLQKNLLEIMKRLKEAKLISEQEITNTTIESLKYLDECDKLTNKIKENLNNLSFYTQEKYDQNNDVFLPIKTEELPEIVSINCQNSLDYQNIEKEIEKKQAEVTQIQESVLPKVDLYAAYRFFGDGDTFTKSIKSVQRKDALVGAQVTVPIIDDLKLPLSYIKLNKELEQLELKKAQIVADYKREITILRDNNKSTSLNIANRTEIYNKAFYNVNINEKLDEQKLIDQKQILKQQIEYILETAALKEAKINRNNNLMQLTIKLKGL